MLKIESRLAAIRRLSPLPAEEQAALDITHIKKGGFLDFQNETWEVQKIFRYLEVKWKNFSLRKNDYWITELELFSLNTGNRLYIEWEIDDELEIFKTDTLVKLRDIRFNNQYLKIADLEKISEDEEGTINYKGQNYHYSDDDSWAAKFFVADIDQNTNKSTGTNLKIYEFESQNGTYLSIEAWHEDDDSKPEREAFISNQIEPKALHILQARSSK
jgi:hypothetical protein